MILYKSNQNTNLWVNNNLHYNRKSRFSTMEHTQHSSIYFCKKDYLVKESAECISFPHWSYDTRFETNNHVFLLFSNVLSSYRVH